MYSLENKDVLVIGLGASGRAACELLREGGANVLGMDSHNSADLRAETERLKPLGVEVQLGQNVAPKRRFNFAVASPSVRDNYLLMQELAEQNVPVIGEMELGYRQSKCLSIAVAGTNGKATTAELIEKMLVASHRKVMLSGHNSRPVCSVVNQSKDLDYLIFQASSFQLETTHFFRPSVAVLTNLARDHMNRYVSMADYVRANARIFSNQQAFDWAIVQSEALALMRALDLPVPSKVITFSAKNRRADIFLERGLLISRLKNWSGPLLNMEDCQLHGPHNIENLMAALAVGHVLRLPLEAMVDCLKTIPHGKHRFESIGEINGVKFIDDSKATNLDAMQKALMGIPTGENNQPNVWLIAGGRDKGAEYHDAGPLLSERVKGAFLVGEAREKIRSAWSLFTPCTLVGSLLEAVTEVARNAVSGDVILLSPACSSFDQFRNYQHRGEVFREIVTSIGGGPDADTHNRNGLKT